ncbi:MAG: cysteine methyltransferase [Candidatus Levybacteria bacterium RIFCSPHIGHO2_01_FULL_37_17]|nr:MAG: cysteine methyltransferase [Candidatus Levybacteria bacterium RIFCSPHIGHO2_01_FULL_37_17]OGH37126.1 MAG: cysteine methyltransferase [Candidatus Levybacteria bacterium RIFCSPLOWO2_01_FULL_38_23]
MNTFDKILDLVAKVPKGKVTTYGALSKIVGVDPRIVGFALNSNKTPDKIPCHRVIKANGKIAEGYAFGGPHVQKDMLENEGIKFNEEKVDLSRFGVFI